MLETYDIPMVPTFAAADADKAVAHASKLFAQGATVVLKIMSRDIVHKSDVGGVVLNLTSADAVRTRPTTFLRARKNATPGRADLRRHRAGDDGAAEGARAHSWPRQ